MSSPPPVGLPWILSNPGWKGGTSREIHPGGIASPLSTIPSLALVPAAKTRLLSAAS